LLAQGSGDRCVEELRATANMSDGRENCLAVLSRFLARFSSQQRKMFLGFTTGQARIPGPAYNSDFFLKISLAGENQDGRLPAAATCDNENGKVILHRFALISTF
jgi:hypothetical protein